MTWDRETLTWNIWDDHPWLSPVPLHVLGPLPLCAEELVAEVAAELVSRRWLRIRQVCRYVV